MKRTILLFCAIIISLMSATAQNRIVVRPTKVHTQETKPDPKPNTSSNQKPTPHKHDGKPAPHRHQHEAQQTQEAKPTTGKLYLEYGTWTGGILNGKPDGKGRLSFTERHVVDRSSTFIADPGDYFEATYSNGSLISGKVYDNTGVLLKTIIP